MAKLILVRHGKSEWNALGLWTGWTDVSLAPEGVEEAKRAGQALKDIKIDKAYVSALKRAQETLSGIVGELGYEIPTVITPAINERDYGIYTGKNKWQVKEEIGEEGFNAIRRGWDVPVPKGETLKVVYERTVPYYQNTILPELMAGKNVIVSAHGNSLRALAKYLENVSDDGVANLEIGTGEIHMYEIDKDGKVVGKEVRASNSVKV